jgi:NAD(P)-dependent dehydrogenase (short-subunit alcohol dehydrogenase family)
VSPAAGAGHPSMRRFEGKTVFVTGAARGQGRSHAARLAREGADVLAVDVCAPLGTVAYPLATPADLAETARLVGAEGRRVVTAQADVRDADALGAAVADGVARLGGLDVVLANAGIGLMDPAADPRQAFRDQLDVNLVGVWNTVHAAVPVLVEQGRGGAVVLTSSAFGLTGRGGDGSSGG